MNLHQATKSLQADIRTFMMSIGISGKALEIEATTCSLAAVAVIYLTYVNQNSSPMDDLANSEISRLQQITNLSRKQLIELNRDRYSDYAHLIAKVLQIEPSPTGAPSVTLAMALYENAGGFNFDSQRC